MHFKAYKSLNSYLFTVLGIVHDKQLGYFESFPEIILSNLHNNFVFQLAKLKRVYCLQVRSERFRLGNIWEPCLGWMIGSPILLIRGFRCRDDLCWFLSILFLRWAWLSGRLIHIWMGREQTKGVFSYGVFVLFTKTHNQCKRDSYIVSYSCCGVWTIVPCVFVETWVIAILHGG